jgi:hypothetical protein
MLDVLSIPVVKVYLPGFQLANEKSRRDPHPAVKAVHVAEQRTAANVAVCKAFQGLGCGLSMVWTSKSGRLVRFRVEPLDGWGRGVPRRPFEGLRVMLERLGPVSLVDASESLRSAFSAVRDGVAEALGVDDAELEAAWGADGEAVSKPGALVWIYEQRRGGARGTPEEWGVRIRIEA